jgi:protein arginine kinase activator
MLCGLCKQNKAKVHLTQITGDKMQKVDLCEECAKEKGVTDPAGFSLADLLLGLGASQEMEEASGGTDLKCPHCGFTQADFKKTGRLGCSECYQTFAGGLEALLKSMHKGTRHAGKIPAGRRRTQDLRERLDALQLQLNKAVMAEDFERAAVLRDDIVQARQDLDAALKS